MGRGEARAASGMIGQYECCNNSAGITPKTMKRVRCWWYSSACTRNFHTETKYG